MKTWMKWTAAAVTIALLGAGTVRLLQARKAKEEALQAQQATLKAAVILSIRAADIHPVQILELPVGIPISGALKATESAMVKARIAGELQNLNVREGDSVKAGQVLARIEPTEYLARLKQAQQQAESAKGQWDIARRNFDNNRALVEQGFISKTALDTSTASLASAQANYQAAQAGADIAHKTLEDGIVRAPIAGQIAQRLAQSGERLGIDARVVEIVNGGKLEMEAALNAADSLLVRPGQTAQLQMDGSNQPIRARVVRINPSANSSTRTVTAYLAIEGSPALRQGLFVQGQLATGSANKVLALPLGTVRTDKPQPYVQVLKDGKVAHMPVEVTQRSVWQGAAYAAIQGVPQDTPDRKSVV